MKQLSSVYEYSDYRAFLRNWVKAKASDGRGQWSRMAKALRVTSTMVSQVMREERNLSPELANDLCDYIGFSEEETRHFLLLVDFARAGSASLKKRLRAQVLESQAQAATLAKRLKASDAMTDKAKARFYSDWIYSGVRNASAISDAQSIDELAVRFNVERKTMTEIVKFLVENELCSSQSGLISVGPQKTHVAADSPFVLSHHRNWRLKAVDAMRSRRETDLFYTGPMSLSVELASEVRKRIPTFLDGLYKELGPSRSEVVRCLNIDWFEY
ncbi:hypothetical protein BH10BDE1_BH10BDE1_23400 [soil metagenome]